MQRGATTTLVRAARLGDAKLKAAGGIRSGNDLEAIAARQALGVAQEVLEGLRGGAPLAGDGNGIAPDLSQLRGSVQAL